MFASPLADTRRLIPLMFGQCCQNLQEGRSLLCNAHFCSLAHIWLKAASRLSHMYIKMHAAINRHLYREITEIKY